MAVRLRNLNESLDRLYESHDEPLTEAFNDSFPKWLKDRLVTTRKTFGTDKGKDREYSNVSRDERPDITTPRGWYGNTRDLGLFSGLLNAGADFDTLQVHEGPIPEKRTDERLKEPNIPIWGFENGQVYIPGINDQETTTIVPEKGRIPFKYVPMKYLLANAKYFAYIKSSDLTPGEYTRKRTQRGEQSKELRDMNYGRKDKDPEQFVKPMPSNYYRNSNEKASLDKSGYIVDPKRFYDKLKQIKASRYGDVLTQYHDLLEEYKEDIISAMQYYDPFENKDEYQLLNSLMGYLRGAIGAYNSVASRIESTANDNFYDDEYKTRRIAKYLESLQNDYDLSQLKSMGDSVFLGSADWLS